MLMVCYLWESLETNESVNWNKQSNISEMINVKVEIIQKELGVGMKFNWEHNFQMLIDAQLHIRLSLWIPDWNNAELKNTIYEYRVEVDSGENNFVEFSDGPFEVLCQVVGI
jgi:hypothetical protein